MVWEDINLNHFSFLFSNSLLFILDQLTFTLLFLHFIPLKWLTMLILQIFEECNNLALIMLSQIGPKQTQAHTDFPLTLFFYLFKSFLKLGRVQLKGVFGLFIYLSGFFFNLKQAISIME